MGVLPAAPAAAPAVQDEDAAPTRGIQAVLAGTLADLMGVAVPADSDFFQDLGADSMVMARFCARVRKLADLPSVSMKDVYQHPTIAGLAAALADRGAPAPVPAPASTEAAFAEVLADVLQVDAVSPDSHFFDDLGADSLVMARFCARVRKLADLPSVSMKDVYQHPTIAGLAAASGSPATAAVGPSTTAQPTAAAEAMPEVVKPEVPEPGGVKLIARWRYRLCGALQFLIFLGYSTLAAVLTDKAATWISGGSTVADIYLRSVVCGAGGFVVLCLLPLVVKWGLIGRWKPQSIRLWSLGYVRFWVVKTVVRANPLALFFVGSPLYTLYLRALGAKVGRRVVILSRYIPVCTDLLRIGDDTVIRKDTFFTGYRAQGGVLQTGAVTLGNNVFVGEKVVLDIDTEIGDGGQLGHTSSLHAGQSVPPGEHWHGSPAQRTELDYLRVAPADCGTFRRVSFSVLTVLKLLFVYLPLVQGGLYLLLNALPSLDRLVGPGVDGLTSPQLYTDAVVVSLVLFFGFIVVGLLFVATVPRLLNLFIKPDRVYPLYGFHYGLHRTITRLTNVKLFTWLFGDSSYIVGYLRALGYKLHKVEQTGSNFGTEVRHESPFLSSVGSGTVVADGLSMMNADFSSSSFRLSRTSIGAHNFLGNNIAYPPGGRTGDNCLLATKVMVPLDGPVREGVGLLGSPSFEIPRTVDRDAKLDHLRTGDELQRGLAGKNGYNLRSMALFLGVRWVHVCMLTIAALAAIDLEGAAAYLAIGAFFAISVVISPLYFVLVERLFTLRRLQPKYCSIYEPYFWWHERLWKVPDSYLNLYNGTPFKTMIWRLLGMRIGTQVFDDGVFVTERTLATIGDGSALNLGSKVQCHSQEDGAFKSDHITLGAGVTLGVGAFIHYGATIGDGATVEADSFLMKGTEVLPLERWGGNPAVELPGPAAPVQSRPDVVPNGHVTHDPAGGRGTAAGDGEILKRSDVAPAPRPGGRHSSDAPSRPAAPAGSRPGGRHRTGQRFTSSTHR